MSSFQKTINVPQVQNYFPEQIDFYDLGVILASDHRITAETYKIIVHFRVTGEEDGQVIIGFDQVPDQREITLEMANILAAKFISAINDKAHIYAELSSPIYLEKSEPGHKEYDVALRNTKAKESITQAFVFRSDSENFNMKLIYLSSKRGNA